MYIRRVSSRGKESRIKIHLGKVELYGKQAIFNMIDATCMVNEVLESVGYLLRKKKLAAHV